MKRKRSRKKYLIIVIIFISIYFCTTIFNNNCNLKYLESEGIYNYNNVDILELEENLHIKRIDYHWERTQSGINHPKVIVFHHSDATIMSPEEVNEIHKEKGWDGIGYHYYIRKDGTIYAGRPEEIIGSHVYGDNRNTIGICLEGDFEDEEPTKEELNSLVNLSVYLILKYNMYECKGHNDLYNTKCPGELFPKEYIKERIYNELINLTEKEDN